MLGQLPRDQRIDSIPHRFVACNPRVLAGHKSPMPLVLPTLGYPPLEKFDLLGRELLATLERGHMKLSLLGLDPLDEQTLLGFARNDHTGSGRTIGLVPPSACPSACPSARLGAMQPLKRIEPQTRFALVGVRSMTKETIVR